MRLLRKNWVLIIFMNLIWLLAIDQINHWTSFLQLHLYPYCFLVIFPALFLSPVYGLIITLITGLLASSYVVSSPIPILPLMLLFHLILHFTRGQLRNTSNTPPLYLVAIVCFFSLVAILPFTPRFMLSQGAFWFRFIVDTIYNMIVIPLLAIPFFQTLNSLLSWARSHKR
jgi:hypothetical protein